MSEVKFNKELYLVVGADDNSNTALLKIFTTEREAFRLAKRYLISELRKDDETSLVEQARRAKTWSELGVVQNNFDDVVRVNRFGGLPELVAGRPTRLA